MKIVLKKRDIVVTVIVMIGMCFFISGMWEYYNVKTALPLEALSSKNVQKGQYIKGTVNEYCGVMVGKTFHGESVSFSSFTGELDYYTVKLRDGKYITLMTKYDGTEGRLEKYRNGVGSYAYIEGVITSPVTELNYPWLQRALGKNSQEEVEELVLSQYAIKERDFSQVGRGMIYGLGVIVTAAIIYVSGIIEKNIVEKMIIESLRTHSFVERIKP